MEVYNIHFYKLDRSVRHSRRIFSYTQQEPLFLSSDLGSRLTFFSEREQFIIEHSKEEGVEEKNIIDLNGPGDYC